MKRNMADIMQALRLSLMMIAIVFELVLLMPSDACSEQSNPDVVLKIYLPREVSIKDNNIHLSDIAILKGDENVIRRLGRTALGKFSVPGQQIVIDKATVLSRLASCGYSTSAVLITGSPQVSVTRQHNIIKSKEFVESARTFLEQHPPDNSISQIKPIGAPVDLILSAGQTNIQLLPRRIENSNRAHATIRVGVFASGKEIASRDITFRLKFDARKIVASVDIPAGAVITSDNIRIEKGVSDYPEPANWKPPYGLVTKRSISANSVVDNTSLGLSKDTVLVERNQMITIRIHRGGLYITALGTALQKGHLGECIKVRNIDSKRIIIAKVCEDGTVEPVF